MEQKLVGFFVGGFAVIARHGDVDVGRHQPALDALEPRQQILGDHHRIGAGAFGKSDADRGHAMPLALRSRHFHPDTVFLRARTDNHRGHIADIDRTIVARRHQQQTDIGNAAQRLPGGDIAHRIVVANAAGLERAIGAPHLVDELLQRHAIERELLRIGLDADLLGAAARNVGQTDIVGLDQFGLQLFGEFVEVFVGPARRGLRLRRQGQHHNGDVIDAAADDQRLRNANRNAIEIGTDLFMDAQDGVIGIGADEESRGHHHPIIDRLAVDVFDPVDALDDFLKRLGHQFDRVRRLEPVGVDPDIHHRDADLRLLLARNGEERDQADREGSQKKQGRQR